MVVGVARAGAGVLRGQLVRADGRSGDRGARRVRRWPAGWPIWSPSLRLREASGVAPRAAAGADAGAGRRGGRRIRPGWPISRQGRYRGLAGRRHRAVRAAGSPARQRADCRIHDRRAGFSRRTVRAVGAADHEQGGPAGSFHDEVLRTTADLDAMLALAGVTGAAVPGAAAQAAAAEQVEVPDTAEGAEMPAPRRRPLRRPPGGSTQGRTTGAAVLDRARAEAATPGMDDTSIIARGRRWTESFPRAPPVAGSAERPVAGPGSRTAGLSHPAAARCRRVSGADAAQQALLDGAGDVPAVRGEHAAGGQPARAATPTGSSSRRGTTRRPGTAGGTTARGPGWRRPRRPAPTPRRARDSTESSRVRSEAYVSAQACSSGSSGSLPSMRIQTRWLGRRGAVAGRHPAGLADVAHVDRPRDARPDARAAPGSGRAARPSSAPRPAAGTSGGRRRVVVQARPRRAGTTPT